MKPLPPTSIPGTWREAIATQSEALKASGAWRELRTPQGIDFTHNDYLGLAGHPRLREAGVRALGEQGTGMRGSRLLGGNSAWYEQAERQIAAWFGAPAALFFSSGYLANQAAVTALGELAGAIVSDEYNHASLIDGVRLAARPKKIVPHNEWAQVGSEGLNEQRPLFVAESLYSMEGDFVDWPALNQQLQKSAGFLILDEAHAVGLFQEGGRGYVLGRGEVDWERTVVTLTFGKAFGVGGAVILSSAAVREWVLNRARSFIYTTSGPPAVLAMVLEGLNLVEGAAERRHDLWHRATWARQKLQPWLGQLARNSDPIWAERSPILPLRIAGNDRALRFSEGMRKLGFDLRAIRYPTVPKGAERIRVSLNLTASWDETVQLVEELEKMLQA